VFLLPDTSDPINSFINEFSKIFPENIRDISIIEEFIQNKIPGKIKKNSELKKEYKTLLTKFNDLLNEIKNKLNDLRKKSKNVDDLSSELKELKKYAFEKRLDILQKLNQIAEKLETKDTDSIEEIIIQEESSIEAKVNLENSEIEEKGPIENLEKIQSEEKILDVKTSSKEKEEEFVIEDKISEEIEVKTDEAIENISETPEISSETIEIPDKVPENLEIEAKLTEIPEIESETIESSEAPLEVPEIEGEPIEVPEAPLKVPEIEGEPIEVPEAPLEVPEIEGEPIEIPEAPLEVPEIGGEPIEVPEAPLEVPEIEGEPIEIPEIPEPPVPIEKHLETSASSIESEPTPGISSVKITQEIKNQELPKTIEIEKKKEEKKLITEVPRPFLSETSPREIIESVIRNNPEIAKLLNKRESVMEFNVLYKKALEKIGKNDFDKALNLLEECLKESVLSKEDKRRKDVNDKIREVCRKLAKKYYDIGMQNYKNKNFNETIKNWKKSQVYYGVGTKEDMEIVVAEESDKSKVAKVCPKCKSQLEFIVQYQRFYCRNCKKYV